MSSHSNDARKIEQIMIKYNLEKNDKNLVAIASQDLDLSIKYVKKLIETEVDNIERAKLNHINISEHQKFKNKRTRD